MSDEIEVNAGLPGLADDDARRHMAIPGHEDAVEVPKAAILALLEERRATDHR